jgi:hypothetical protein
MKICVIAPSDQYLALAGVRIRYQRIATRLAALGHELRIAVVDTLNKAAALTDDVYLISKCYDARALVVARLLADNGKVVGADFFDDYFSQAGDSRFVRHREWVRDMAGFLDFFLCSTARMRDVIAGYLGDRPGHVMNDPFNSFDLDAVQARLEANLRDARSRRRIDVLWFGVGDNPHFSVGLDDLSGYGHVLGALAGGGYDVRLSILTNARALTADGLERLRRLPVPYRVEEWSERKEADYLARSLAAFLPVNAQPFSAAKSLNRAVSALTAGVQVLSPGYPLYAPLSRFIYDDAARLRDDLDNGALALRGETLPGLMELFATWGDPEREAEKLAAFLEGVRQAKPPLDAPEVPTVVGVVNGKRGAVEAHKYAQRTGHLSIASPFCVDSLNYDVEFVLGEGSDLDILLSPSAAKRLDPRLEALARPGVLRNGKPAKLVSLTALGVDDTARKRLAPLRNSKILALASYEETLTILWDVLGRALPDVELRLSEVESPFRAALSVPAARPARNVGEAAR